MLIQFQYSMFPPGPFFPLGPLIDAYYAEDRRNSLRVLFLDLVRTLEDIQKANRVLGTNDGIVSC